MPTAPQSSGTSQQPGLRAWDPQLDGDEPGHEGDRHQPGGAGEQDRDDGEGHDGGTLDPAMRQAPVRGNVRPRRWSTTASFAGVRARKASTPAPPTARPAHEGTRARPSATGSRVAPAAVLGRDCDRPQGRARAGIGRGRHDQMPATRRDGCVVTVVTGRYPVPAGSAGPLRIS